MKPRRTNVRGIIFRDGKLLVTKFRQDDGGESEHWGTFGGGLDDNESVTDGLQREMVEETGIVPKVGRLLFIQQFKEDDREFFELFFHIENPEDYEIVRLEDTTHGIQELTRSEFVDPKTTFIKPVFLSKVDIAAHISGAEPVVIHNEL